MAFGFLHQLPGFQLKSRNLSPALYFAWFAVSFLLLVTLPTALRLGIPFWTLPIDQISQVYVPGAAYLIFSLVLFYASKQVSGLNIIQAAMLGITCFFLAYGTLLLVPDLVYSRSALLVSIVLGISLAIPPLWLNNRQIALSTLLLALLLVAVVARVLLQPTPVEEDEGRWQQSALYSLDLTTQENIVGQLEMDGGAIERLNDGFILVTGSGEFYHLQWSENGDELVSTRLPISSPITDRDAFFTEVEGRAYRYRVTDLLIQQSGQDYQLFVAHQSWNQAKKCFTMKVSRATLSTTSEKPAEAENSWTTIYETQPCLAISDSFDSVETGGRIAWTRSGEILMTVGDHGLDGNNAPALAQQSDTDYGKVLLLDKQGGAAVFTSGHRNPQGLLVDKLGQAWVTEHGPQGGDEVNLLGAGKNYGWPMVTYGTDYSQLTWPLAPNSRNHEGFTEPTHAFVPSVAISNLIQLSGREFPRWEDDFLLGSLRMQSLYRLRMRDNRVIYVEPILIGREIRDLAEASDGRVLLWSDDGSITVLSKRMEKRSGKEVFEQCRSCHEAKGKAAATAPDLQGVIGRQIATRPDFNYSSSLRKVEGIWTDKRLAEFLENPQAFAPGTAMGSVGVIDPTERRAVVEYLKNYERHGS